MTVIVLLGILEKTGRDAREMDLRCQTAARIYRGSDSARVIVCGGRTGSEARPEAEAMRNRLLGLGIDAADIALETDSRTTMENLTNARELLNAAGEEELVVVTSDYHIRRTRLIARRLGLNARFEGARLPMTPDKLRKCFMEGLYTLDLLFGFEEPGARRPWWARFVMRLLSPDKLRCFL